MSILKQIAQAMFRQHRGKRVMPGRRIVRKSRQRHTRNTPVTAVRQRSVPIKSITNKREVKTQTPFKAMVNLASIFVDKSTNYKHTNSIRLTKIPLPSQENGKLRIQATDLESWFAGTIKTKDSDNRHTIRQ